MNIKAAIFDMDGTLIDSLKIWNVLWSKIGEEFLNDKNFMPRKEDDKKVRTLMFKDAMELIHVNYHVGKSGNEVLDFANQVLIHFYDKEVTLKEGVRDFLEYCHGNGVKMCLATASTPDLLKLAINHCDIGKYFLNTFSCSILGKGKEEPDIYLLASDFLGEKLSETWVFEDSLVAIETATKIGIPTVGIYDANNFGQDKIAKIASVYVDKGETLLKLIKT